MAPPSRRPSRPRSTSAIAWSAAEHLKREAELADGFKKQGLESTRPTSTRSATYAQKVYLASDEAKDWPKGCSRRSTR
jgi:hypothetical protein